MSVETEPGQDRNRALRALGIITVVAFVVVAVCIGVISAWSVPTDASVRLRPWLSFVVIGVGLIASFTVLVTLFMVIKRVICGWTIGLQIVIQVVYVLAAVAVALFIFFVALFGVSGVNGKTVKIDEKEYVGISGFLDPDLCYHKTLGPFLMENKCSFNGNPNGGGSPVISPPEQ